MRPAVGGLPKKGSQGIYHATPHAYDPTDEDDIHKNVACAGKPFHATPCKAGPLDRTGSPDRALLPGIYFRPGTNSLNRSNEMAALRDLYGTMGVGGLVSKRVTNDELTFIVAEIVFHTSKTEPSVEELP